MGWPLINIFPLAATTGSWSLVLESAPQPWIVQRKRQTKPNRQNLVMLIDKPRLKKEKGRGKSTPPCKTLSHGSIVVIDLAISLGDHGSEGADVDSLAQEAARTIAHGDIGPTRVESVDFIAVTAIDAAGSTGGHAVC